MRAMALALLLVAAGKPPARNLVPQLLKSCDSDDARACAELARRYRAGDGVPRDMAKAVEAMQDGCEAGEPAPCVEAGRAVLRGEGVKSDPARARELFSDACTQRTHADTLPAATADATPTEQVVLAVWEDILQKKGIGIKDDFFDLGGTSLALIRIFARVNERFSVSLNGSILVDEPSVSRLAYCIDEQLKDHQAPMEVLGRN